MADQGVTRKLTAIFYADVAGYSRLTGADEEGTHHLVSAYLDAITASIETHNGTVLHFAGDAILADFPTVSDALICGINTQHDLKDRNKDLRDDRKVQFRVGINLGEVIVDRGEIFGDGVNVAARLESLAEPGGICISAAVHDAVGTKLPLDYEFMGEQSVKNIAEPVRAYSVQLKPGGVLPAPSIRKTGWSTRRRIAVGAAAVVLVVGAVMLVTGGGWINWFAPKPQPTVAVAESDPVAQDCAALQDKPTIAVLPFANLSGDPKQGYLSDGISEDIITRLAQRRDMMVAARTSSFAFKGKSLTVPEIGRKLRVGYVLEGSIQKAGDRIRITTQLIEAATGNQLWVERYDRETKDLFAMQDEITHRVAVELAATLTEGEVARINFRSTDNFTAYEYYLRGMKVVEKRSKKTFERARKFFEKAIENDPQYARAITGLGWIYVARRYQRAWRYDPEESLKRAEELAVQALAIDGNSAAARALLSRVNVYKGQYEQAIAEGRRAVALEPNNPEHYGNLARDMFYAGQPQDARQIVARALCLSPYPTMGLLSTAALTHYLSGQYEATIATSRKMLARKSGRVTVSLKRIIAS